MSANEVGDRRGAALAGSRAPWRLHELDVEHLVHDGAKRGETVPEFERAPFADTLLGIRRELVRTRFGFHIVAVDHRVAGTPLPFDAVRDQVAAHLRSQVLERALAQYVSVLAGAADVRGADLAAAPTPLVQ